MPGHAIVAHALPRPRRREQRIALRFDRRQREGQAAGPAGAQHGHSFERALDPGVVAAHLPPVHAGTLQPARRDAEQPSARQVGDDREVPVGAAPGGLAVITDDIRRNVPAPA